MEKHTATSHEIHKLIAKRWSPRAFKQEAISAEELNKLFEAARWAPSSMNEQPWRFLYARNGEKSFNDIFDSLMDGNKPWAEKAPILLVTLVKKTFSNGRPNAAAQHDLGLSIGNLSIQATELGIGLHQMGGFHQDILHKNFNIPDDYEAVTVIALGYYGDPDQLDAPYKERELAERKRKPIEAFAFHGAFSLN